MESIPSKFLPNISLGSLSAESHNNLSNEEMLRKLAEFYDGDECGHCSKSEVIKIDNRPGHESISISK